MARLRHRAQTAGTLWPRWGWVFVQELSGGRQGSHQGTDRVVLAVRNGVCFPGQENSFFSFQAPLSSWFCN